MNPVRRWFFGHSPAEPSLRTALTETFARWAPKPPRAALDIDASVALDDGTGAVWTVRIQNGRFTLEAGQSRHAETTIFGDPLTLIGIVRGQRSGVEAFLRGRLRVRGSLALALKLDGLFDRRERPSQRPRPHRADAAGIDTFYLDAGSGPTVVLLHGLGATNASMLPTLWALSDRYRVLAPDLPGFGDSAKPAGKYDPAFFVNWLVAFLDAAGVSRAHLVGNSMGGRIAIETALVAKDRVDRIALLAPSMAFRKFRHAVPIVKFLMPEMGAVPLPVLRPHILQGVKLLFARPEVLHGSWYEAATDEFLRVFRTPRGRVSFFAAARQIYLERPFGPRGFWPRLEGLETPALFVWGDRDRLVPSGFARHVERSVPHARSVVLENCGHVPQFEHADATHRLVAQFLAEAHGVTRCDDRRSSAVE